MSSSLLPSSSLLSCIGSLLGLGSTLDNARLEGFKTGTSKAVGSAIGFIKLGSEEVRGIRGILLGVAGGYEDEALGFLPVGSAGRLARDGRIFGACVDDGIGTEVAVRDGCELIRLAGFATDGAAGGTVEGAKLTTLVKLLGGSEASTLTEQPFHAGS